MAEDMEMLFDESLADDRYCGASCHSDASQNHLDIVRSRFPCISAIAKVEAIFEQIASSLLLCSDAPVIHLKRRPPILSSNPGDSTVDNASNVEISFPGKTKQEAWQFSVLVRILGLMHEALQAGAVTTKRDIFYKDPTLFVKQTVVDRYVDDIAFTFGLPRSALNVAAAAKGLYAGSLALTSGKDVLFHGNANGEASLVPELRHSGSMQLSGAMFILVIEKEATFHSILSTDIGRGILRYAVVVTGKGYPDISTRAFLHCLSTATNLITHSPIPVYALVDYDPDGLAILTTYKYGSRALPHENSALIVPSMQWLGLTSNDVMDEIRMKSNDEHDESSVTTTGSPSFICLSTRDRKKAVSMLRWSHFEESWEPFFKRELQVMLMLNMKAEIQVLDGSANGVLNWIMQKLDSV